MSGIKELKTLLSTMEPELHQEEFVFCTFRNTTLDSVVHLNPIATFQEREGLSLVLTKSKAAANHIPFETVYSLISLNVHSSLDAVGLTAAISNQLASRQISANVIAAYYHDHIFIQKDKAEEALQCMMELQNP